MEKLSKCETHRAEEQAKHVIGNFIPRCEEDGRYSAEQFWGSTGYSWCVDQETGDEVEGTKTGPTVTNVNCGK